VDEDLSLGGIGLGLLFGSFDEFSVLESGSVADESDEVGCVDRAPVVLGGFDELACHREAGGAGAGCAGDLRAVSDCGEGRLDRYLEPTG
jgi:hypothetical protein